MTLADEGRLPRPGERIGRYEIAALVGRGGMAAVYAVRLRSVGGFGNVLAMKVLLPHLDGPDLVTMFIDEARIAAQIQHPNVAQLFELGEHQGTPFVVMELLRGRSLAQVAERSRQRGEPLSRGFVLRVFADTARGLHAAHEARGEDGEPLAVIHRDVSPQNVHVGYDGLVKVVDFGIARARSQHDGARHREREVALEVAPERTALVVQIVGDDGATHDRTIDARVAEHSLELAPPEPVAAPRARARTRPARPAPRRTRAPPRGESRDRALLGNTY